MLMSAPLMSNRRWRGGHFNMGISGGGTGVALIRAAPKYSLSAFTSAKINKKYYVAQDTLPK